MKVWNREVCGDLVEKKKNLQGKINEVNCKERENYVSQEEIAEKEEWKNELDHLNLLRQQKMKLR